MSYDQFVIRPLISADIPHVQDLHRLLLPVRYPQSFFLNLLIQPGRACMVVHLPTSNTPVAFISASITPLPLSCASAFSLDSYLSRGLQKMSFNPTRSQLCSPSLDTDQVHILTLGVHPAYQHNGLARRLVYAIIASLRGPKSVSGTVIYAHVQSTNIPARKFYARIGMTISSEILVNLYRFSEIKESERDGVLMMGCIG